jgi:hypothetical protein
MNLFLFQICIGLRLSCNLCTPHICKCNAKVDEIGIHGLSCSKSSGRFSRHSEINSIINRSLTSIHDNSTLEPNGKRIHLSFPPEGGRAAEAFQSLFSHIDGKIRDGYGVDGCGRKVVGTAEVDTDPAIALSVI